MSGFYVRRSGFTSTGELTVSLINDLMANGFTLVAPTSWTDPSESTSKDAYVFKVLLEAGPSVDPLNDDAVEVKQPWRICFDCPDIYTLGVTVGSQQSLRVALGKPSYSWDVKNGAPYGPRGTLGVVFSGGSTSTSLGLDGIVPNSANAAEAFVNRKTRVIVGDYDFSTSYPMSYALSITPRGVMFCLWEDYTSDINVTVSSWFCIQRPVDRITGATITEGKAPVFCVYSTQNNVKRFVVRESDVLKTSDQVDATVDADYVNAVINKEQQIAISEGNKYVVNFPSRLNTTRYAYTHELDMLGYTSADVVSENTDVSFTVYSESADRTYSSLFSNGVNNTGMRMLMLKSGGGIS